MSVKRKLVFVLVCVLSSGAQAAWPSKFCANPGDTLDEVRKKCDSMRPVVEYTEEGEVVSYLAASGKMQALVEVSSGVVDLVRFKGGILPIEGVHVGDRFADVRRKFPGLTLVADAGEQGSIALADERRAVFVVFGVSDVSSDWFFNLPHREADIANIRVTGVNLVSP